MKRSGMLGVDTRASIRQAVVLTLCPTSPVGSEGIASVADSRSCGATDGVFEGVGFSTGRVGASEEKRVELRLL
jgi:hypothetical protein